MTKKQKRLLLGLMALIMIVLNSDANVMSPTLKLIETEFGINDAAIGVMMGLFTIIGAVVSLLWGYYADKASRKFLMVLSVGLGEIPCLLTAFAPNYPIFFLLRILTGIGIGAAFPLAFSILGDIYDEKERPVASAILTTSFAFGKIIGTIAGGYLGDAFGWRLPFVVVAAPNIPLIIIFALVVPEPKKGASEEATKELVAQGVLYPKIIRLADYVKLAKIKTNVYLFIQGILGTVPWGAIFFLNKFLNINKGLTIAAATTIYMIFGIGMILGILVGGKLGGVVFQKQPALLPKFCSLTTAAGAVFTIAVVLFIPPDLIILSLSGFLAAFLAAMTGPNMRTMLLDTNTPENRGPIFSIFNLTDSLGEGLGKFVAGTLSVALGLSASLSICSGFWFLCALVLWLAASIFPQDITKLHAEMEAIAREMKDEGRAT
ncbi:MAG: MFS transporter [Spirochaetota bacterium]